MRAREKHDTLFYCVRFLTLARFAQQLLSLSGQVQAEKNFIDAAVAAGCKYLVKLGTVRSYTSKDSAVEYARFHAEIEDYLETTAGAMRWTVLCPNWFMSNHLGDIFGTLPNSIIAYPLKPDAKATIVDPRDVGDLAAALLVAPDPSVYHALKLDVSGPEAISLGEIAGLYTEALSRPVQPVECRHALSPLHSCARSLLASTMRPSAARGVQARFLKCALLCISIQ